MKPSTTTSWFKAVKRRCCYGGEMVGGRTTQPHEIRGPSIKGGKEQKLGAGDVVHIAAGVPHQTLVAAGKQFTYFLIKVRK